jgi:predicted dehydrogenase
MDQVRIGIIGLGNIGSGHAGCIIREEITGCRLAAVCDSNPECLQLAGANFGEAVRIFGDVEALLAAGVVDAVIVATTHYSHPELAIRCLRSGLHLLVEKPAGVFTRQVREMNEVAAGSGKVFGIMYNRRTNPVYQKLRDLIRRGELGQLRRTNWYRP